MWELQLHAAAQFGSKYGSLILFTFVAIKIKLFVIIWTMKFGYTIFTDAFIIAENNAFPKKGEKERKGGREAWMRPSRP